MKGICDMTLLNILTLRNRIYKYFLLVRVLSVGRAWVRGEQSVPAPDDGAGGGVAGAGDLVHRDLGHAHDHAPCRKVTMHRVQLVENTHIQTPEWRRKGQRVHIGSVICSTFLVDPSRGTWLDGCRKGQSFRWLAYFSF